MCITFTPNNEGQKGYLGYTGLKSCDIRYDPTDFEWELSTFGSKERLFWAVSGASKESALLGTHDWTIYNDSRECTGELEFKTRLSLTACIVSRSSPALMVSVWTWSTGVMGRWTVLTRVMR